MMVEMLSIFTAFSYGLSAVLTRKGMMGSNPLTGTLIASLVQFLVLSVLLIVSPPSQLIWIGLVFFLASGVLASAMGRLCNYMSIERLGVACSASIIGSSPLFSIVFAFILMGENITISVFIGTMLVVAGIALTSWGGNGGSGLRKSALILPMASSAFYGASSAVRKMGLNVLPEPALGAMVGAAASLAIFTTYLVAGRRRESFKLGSVSLRYFVVSGFVVSLGWLSMFTALLAGKVSVVSTLIGTNPFFSLLLSWLLLRGSEKLGRRAVGGCLAIVAGASIITLF